MLSEGSFCMSVITALARGGGGGWGRGKEGGGGDGQDSVETLEDFLRNSWKWFYFFSHQERIRSVCFKDILRKLFQNHQQILSGLGVTAFKFVILGGKSAVLRSEISFYALAEP